MTYFWLCIKRLTGAASKNDHVKKDLVRLISLKNNETLQIDPVLILQRGYKPFIRNALDLLVARLSDFLVYIL